MANPAGAVARWQKANLKIWTEVAIGTAISGNADLVFRNIDMGPWPKVGRSVDEWPHGTDGYPMKVAGDYSVGVARPTITFRLPLTKESLSLGLASVLQGGYESTLDYVFNFTLATAPIYSAASAASPPVMSSNAKYFMMIEAGWAQADGYTVRQGLGFVCKRLSLVFPAVGTDGGMPELEFECIAGKCDTDGAAFTGTDPVVDSEAPPRSKDLAFTELSDASNKWISASLQIENNADWDPSQGDTAAGIQLGDLKISGDVTVAMALAADEYGTIAAAYKAKDVKALTWTISSFLAFTTSVLWQEPGDPALQGNVSASTIPFIGVRVGNTDPQFTVTGGATDSILTNWITPD